MLGLLRAKTLSATKRDVTSFNSALCTMLQVGKVRKTQFEFVAPVITVIHFWTLQAMKVPIGPHVIKNGRAVIIIALDNLHRLITLSKFWTNLNYLLGGQTWSLQE